jgi:hypothetical protein
MRQLTGGVGCAGAADPSAMIPWRIRWSSREAASGYHRGSRTATSPRLMKRVPFCDKRLVIAVAYASIIVEVDENQPAERQPIPHPAG